MATARNPEESKSGCGSLKPLASLAIKRFAGTDSSCHSLRGPGLRRFRLHALAPRSRRFLTHGAIFQETHHAAHGSPPPALSLALERTRVFHRTPDASSRRRRLRSSLGRQTRHNARTTRQSPRRPPRQVRHPLGPARRPLFLVRSTRLAPARGVQTSLGILGGSA